jgi:hypothetical protein
MSKTPAPKEAKKRGKRAGKLADLPAKTLNGKDAAKIRGGWETHEIKLKY